MAGVFGMTRKHDFDLTVQPFRCHGCGKTQAEVSGLPCAGGYRHRLVDAEVDGSIKRAMENILREERREW